MSKWTSDPKDLKKIEDCSRQIMMVAIVEATLESGHVVEGAVRNINMGNNAATALRDGRWLYYGNFDLETLDGQRINIDMCDVKSIQNMWTQKSSAYEKAGLIKIVR